MTEQKIRTASARETDQRLFLKQSDFFQNLKGVILSNRYVVIINAAGVPLAKCMPMRWYSEQYGSMEECFAAQAALSDVLLCEFDSTMFNYLRATATDFVLTLVDSTEPRSVHSKTYVYAEICFVGPEEKSQLGLEYHENLALRTKRDLALVQSYQGSQVEPMMTAERMLELAAKEAGGCVSVGGLLHSVGALQNEIPHEGPPPHLDGVEAPPEVAEQALEHVDRVRQGLDEMEAGAEERGTPCAIAECLPDELKEPVEDGSEE